MPIHMRLPKLKGFRNRFKVVFQVVNLDRLAELFPDGGEIGPIELVEAGAVRKGQPVKVLGTGDLGGVKLEITAHAFSASAREKIAAAGGSVTELGRRASRPPDVRSMWRPPSPVACGARRAPSVGAGVMCPSVLLESVRRARCDDRAVAVRAAPTRDADPPPPAAASRRRMKLLSAFLSAFKTPDLRKKMLFTLAMIAHLPARRDAAQPGRLVRQRAAVHRRASDSGDDSDVFTLLNLFSGGALLQLSVFALGIMPYITASIILQLLTVVIPRLEQLKQGGAGRAGEDHPVHPVPDARAWRSCRRRRSSRWPAPVSCSTTSATTFPIIPRTPALPIWLTVIVLVITMTAGTGVIMWLGELITDRGVGNGMSVLIFTSIAARLPVRGLQILQSSKAGFVVVLGIGVAGHHRSWSSSSRRSAGCRCSTPSA